MKRTMRTMLMAVVAIMFMVGTTGCGQQINTGNVGVLSHLGKVRMEEKSDGFKVFFPFIETMTEWSTKEIEMSLTDLTPRAFDNLAMEKVDVSIWYKVDASQVAELLVKYSEPNAYRGEGGTRYPAYSVVFKEARDAVYKVVATLESLEMHKEREVIADGVKDILQVSLDADDPGVFEITRVVVRAVVTNRSIDAAITMAVENEKKLEAKRIEKEIERENADIEYIRAEGVARANGVINNTLTSEYLQHELNMALMAFAASGSNTVLVPYGMEGMGVMIDQFSRIGGGGE